MGVRPAACRVPLCTSTCTPLLKFDFLGNSTRDSLGSPYCMLVLERGQNGAWSQTLTGTWSSADLVRASPHGRRSEDPGISRIAKPGISHTAMAIFTAYLVGNY